MFRRVFMGKKSWLGSSGPESVKACLPPARRVLHSDPRFPAQVVMLPGPGEFGFKFSREYKHLLGSFHDVYPGAKHLRHLQSPFGTERRRYLRRISVGAPT